MMLAEFVYLSFFPGTNMSWILIVSLASCPLSLPYMLIGTKSCNNNLIGYLEEKKKFRNFCLSLSNWVMILEFITVGFDLLCLSPLGS